VCVCVGRRYRLDKVRSTHKHERDKRERSERESAKSGRRGRTEPAYYGQSEPA
jgi:hypothetical protein